MFKPIHAPEDHNLNFHYDGNPKTHEKPLLYTWTGVKCSKYKGLSGTSSCA